VLLSDELYPGDAFPVEELTGQRRRLWALVRFLGQVRGAAAPERYLPSHAELREQAAGLLGLPASQVPWTQVDAAARVVDQYTQHHDERLPHDRAALEQFAQDQAPGLPQDGGHPVRAYGSLLQFAGRGGDSRPGPADVAGLLGLFPAAERTPQ